MIGMRSWTKKIGASRMGIARAANACGNGISRKCKQVLIVLVYLFVRFGTEGFSSYVF